MITVIIGARDGDGCGGNAGDYSQQSRSDSCVENGNNLLLKLVV